MQSSRALSAGSGGYVAVGESWAELLLVSLRSEWLDRVTFCGKDQPLMITVLIVKNSPDG